MIVQSSPRSITAVPHEHETAGKASLGARLMQSRPVEHPSAAPAATREFGERQAVASPVSVFALAADIWHGKTVLRSLSDRALMRHVVLRGVTLDIGGGASAYLKRLPTEGDVVPVVMDVQIAARPSVVATAEGGLPFLTGVVQTLLLHNVIEHIYSYEPLLEEMRRVVAPGGAVYVSVPFLVPLHEWTGPSGYSDYHRLSEATLERLLGRFSALRLEALEVGPFVAACHVTFSAIPLRMLRVLAVLAGSFGDWMYRHLRRRRDPHTRISFVLGYVAVARR